MVIFGSGEIIMTYWSLELGKYVVFKNTPLYYRTLRSNALFIKNHNFANRDDLLYREVSWVSSRFFAVFLV